MKFIRYVHKFLSFIGGFTSKPLKLKDLKSFLEDLSSYYETPAEFHPSMIIDDIYIFIIEQ